LRAPAIVSTAIAILSTAPSFYFFFLMIRPPPTSTLSPYTTLFRSLGNVTAHLHWHVIPRHQRDRHFPRPIWAEPARADVPRRPAPDRGALAAALKRRLD